MIRRRDFLTHSIKCSPILAGAGLLPCIARAVLNPIDGLALPLGNADSEEDLVRSAPKARFWVSNAGAGSGCQHCHAPDQKHVQPQFKHRDVIVKCLLCAQGCVLRSGDRGRCRARINVGGEMRSLVYGRPVAIHVDPIEKKPFYHFLPGSTAYSLATAGCPLRCKFCQNWEISQSRPEDHSGPFVAPAALLDSAVARKSPVIAFTYNEPTVFVEYLTDIARLARKRDIRCTLVSCGFMNEEPLREMCDVLAAIKIDLKGFDEDFYRKVCSAELRPVLRSIKQIAKSRVHLEIVNLVVPTLNDSETMLKGLIDWIAGELGPDVPVHFTRFHPDYQLLNLPPTPVATLERARDIAQSKGIRYAFVGNVPDHPGNHTYCPGCAGIVIRRNAFFVVEMNLVGGRCKFCKRPIAGVWS